MKNFLKWLMIWSIALAISSVVSFYVFKMEQHVSLEWLLLFSVLSKIAEDLESIKSEKVREYDKD